MKSLVLFNNVLGVVAIMQNEQKFQEVKFYLDRAIDSAVMLTRSIIKNPRLSLEDQLEAMTIIANFHGSLALDIQKSIHGSNVVLSLKEEPSTSQGKS